MKILLIEPNKAPITTDIDSSLESMQNIVGGFIQAIYPFEDNVAVICNDEGKLLGMPLNRALRESETNEIYDIICGTFFICGLGEEKFDSLIDEMIEKYANVFRLPETFALIDGKIICIKG